VRRSSDAEPSLDGSLWYESDLEESLLDDFDLEESLLDDLDSLLLLEDFDREESLLDDFDLEEYLLEDLDREESFLEDLDDFCRLDFSSRSFKMINFLSNSCSSNFIADFTSGTVLTSDCICGCVLAPRM